MRRKPKLKVTTSPPRPRAGERVTVWLELTSKSRTPVSECSATLVVSEQVYPQAMAYAGGRHEYLRLRADFGEMVLTPGKKRLSAVFELPRTLPPTFTSSVVVVEAELFVAVRIPWWRDLEERFVLDIAPGAFEPSPVGAKVYTSHEHGARAGEPMMEATLDPGSLGLGGTFAFAVSTDPLPTKLEAALVPSAALRGNGQPLFPLARHQVALGPASAPRVPLQFQLAIPKDAPPTMDLALTAIRWSFSLSAKFRGRPPVELSIPVQMASLPGQAPAVALPSIGEERRALVFEEVGRRLSLSTDALNRRLIGRAGVVDVRIVGRASGAGVDATLAWPAAGIDLELRKEAWTDRLRLARAERHDGVFVYARELAQAASFAAPALLSELRVFPDFVVGDSDATLSMDRGAERVSTLRAFVDATLRLARLIDAALVIVPPPAKGADALPAWRAFAKGHGARLEVGSLSLRDMPWEEALVDVETSWSDDGEPVETALLTELEETHEVAPALLDAARADLPALSLAGGRVRLATPGLVADPSYLAEELSKFVAARSKLTGKRRVGAYR